VRKCLKFSVRRRYRPALVVLMLAGFCARLQTRAAEPLAPAIITLKPSVAVPDDLVEIGEIADLRGSNEALRAKIARLDILDAPLPGRMEIVTPSLVHIRLSLAGVRDDEYRLEGAERVQVSLREARPDAAASVVDAIQAEMARHLFVEKDDVEVVLLRPLPERSSEIDMSRPNLSFRPYLPPNAQLGNLRVKVGVFLNDRMEDVLPVSAEVRLFQTVVRAARPIDRGAVLDKDNVHVERVALTQRMNGSTADEMLGKKARRPLAPGNLIQERDVDKGSEKAQDPILIRPRDSVRLVARKRGLTVIVSSAEALQAGRRGDTIQVRNTTSKKIITGRVIDQSEVEVAF